MTARLDPSHLAHAVAESSLEWKLTDPLAFGLTTATPLQRAICRVADGVPLGDLAKHRDVRAAIGDVSALEVGHRPKEFCVIAGIRGAKSLIAACAAVHMALTVDLTGLRAGEVPRIPVVSLQKDLAAVVVGHLAGTLTSSPMLRRFLIGDPNGEGVTLRHPCGTPIEIRVAAGARAGATLVARWMAGCIFDEFPRMVGGESGVVNWDDQRNAVIGRIRDGCQIWHIGSPSAPYGPAYDLVTSHHGSPRRDLVVVRAPGPAMNPFYWTPQRLAELKINNPAAYKTDGCAEFATAEEAMFSSASIDACTRKGDVTLERLPGHTYFAAMDPATRGNGWTLAIATKTADGRVVVVDAHEWIGSRDEPLDPAVVLKEIAVRTLAYGVTNVFSDQVMGDALLSLARQAGLNLVQQMHLSAQKTRKFLTIRTHLDRGMISLPPVKAMRTDLLHVRRVPTPAGVAIKLPQTSDGRHCDWAPTLMLVLSRLLPEPESDTPRKPGDDPETSAIRREVMKRFGVKKEVW